jgi:hypothetical protein
MGAWGAGSFENDTAMDWTYDVRSVADVRAPFDRLKVITDESAPEEPVLDADFACELVAAAETVALLMGRRSRDFPEELAARFAGTDGPDDLLFHQARNAVLYVLRKSELAELWEEGVEEGGANQWHVEMTGLIDRLNPDIEPIPWTDEDIEQHAGSSAGPCAFCDKPVPRTELFGISVTDYSTMDSMGRGFWTHLACLNARLHHKHVIADLKFDPDRPFDPDLL